ncbi:MAG: rhodanese-like domain-containing protein [Bdellovibrionales bacterium]
MSAKHNFLSSQIPHLMPLSWVGMLALLLAVILTSCQSPPTRVGESQKREFHLVTGKAQKPLAITDETVILDARSPFDYGLNRVQNSLHLQWSDLAENPRTGEILRDRRKLALRLALNGLRPELPVIVVGYGREGGGEAGRLAWTLLYLGFRDVQVAGIEVFRKNLTQVPSPPAKNVEPWTLHPREELVITKEEFAKLALDPKFRLENRIHMIDVRSDQEYFKQPVRAPGTKGTPDLNLLHIEWKELYSAQGRPDTKFREKLIALGVRPEDRVIFVSNAGVRAAAAAYALLALGYTRVQVHLGSGNAK